jgi:hypothetical protein
MCIGLQGRKKFQYLFSNYFKQITVNSTPYIFILRFDNFAGNCQIGTLLNFRGNMICASPFLTFVKILTRDAIL